MSHCDVNTNVQAQNDNVGTEEWRQQYAKDMLHSLQLIFANLLGGQLQYYTPKRFWRQFRCVSLLRSSMHITYQRTVGKKYVNLMSFGCLWVVETL